MQELNWYIHRLGSMSPPEMLARLRSMGRDCLDRLLLARRQRPRDPADFLVPASPSATPWQALFGCAAAGALECDQLPRAAWLEELTARADAIAGHRLSFFDLRDRHLGEPIDWNRDHGSGRAAPMTFAPSIDYRDFNVTGDCKYVWEPSRHHHLVVLGRAYRATGRPAYAAAAAEQLRSWLDQCPYGLGMQWRSGLELGIRLINWVWTLELIGPSGAVSGELEGRLLDSADRHLWEIARKYSAGSAANNHLIGEAAGVYVAAGFFARLGRAGRLRAEARRLLIEQMAAQTYADGGDREQAIGYHLFAAQLFLVAGLVSRRLGEPMPGTYWQRLEKMFEFLAVLSQAGRPPMFGDSDDGYVLDLAGQGSGRDEREWLSAAAGVFCRPDFKAAAGGTSQTAWWLLGERAWQALEAVAPAHTPLACRALSETGYYLLQGRWENLPVSVVFDCGQLGLGRLAAHGHADALSFTLRLGGEDVLVDPGTYDYFTWPAWRRHLRSTAAHNTVQLDGRDQSVVQGPFLWGRKARAVLESWRPGQRGGRVAGRHDGYLRLRDGVLHRRSLSLDAPAGRLIVQDELRCRGGHDAAVWFHFAEQCRLLGQHGQTLTVDAGAALVELELDAALAAETVTGDGSRPVGWVSRGYHSKAASLSIVGRCRCRGSTKLSCTIRLRPPSDRAG